jgi:predicted nucleic acid-binding protein
MPANVVFLDTQGWFALLNAADNLHVAAKAEWNRLSDAGYSVLLTDWIIAETGNGLARTAARPGFVESARRFLGDPLARVVTVTPELLARALILYQQRSDKTWGLVDCASFIVMRDEGVTEAFTNDEHFTQAGFTCLLPKP